MDTNSFDVVGNAAGKVFLKGGYAVLEPQYMGYVNAITAQVHAGVSLIDQGQVRIVVPQFKMDFVGAIVKQTGAVEIDAPAELRIVVTAVDFSARFLTANRIPLKGIHVETQNDAAFEYNLEDRDSGKKLSKSGLGSSSAVSVAAVGSILAAHGVGNLHVVHNIAQAVHAHATGKTGSGFDIASATYGSILYRRYQPSVLNVLKEQFTSGQISVLANSDWGYHVENFPFPKGLSLVLANFDGRAMVSSIAISNVMELKREDPEYYYTLLGGIDTLTARYVEHLRNLNDGSKMASDIDGLRKAIDLERALRRRLGKASGLEIEPQDATELIERSKQHGAIFATLPGSGGYDSIAAVCKSGEDAERLKAFWTSVRGEYGISLKDGIGISNAGFTVKKHAVKM